MFKKIALFFVFFILASNISHARDIEVYFTPSYKALDAIVDVLNTSSKSIDIAMFNFTSRPLAHAIITAKKRGVKIRIVLDRSSNDPSENKYTKYTFLKNNGIDVRFAKRHKHWDYYGIMHNKFAIVDSKVVVTGSANWTASAFVRNDENVVIIDRTDIANVYGKEFDILWKNSKVK
jgi:phosphatidylserine/phosphatidylglycerophosphate/cardiolipin synthase-like enzyme